MSERGHLQSLASSISSVESPLRGYLSDLHEKYSSYTHGSVANYIPELRCQARVVWYSIATPTAASSKWATATGCSRFSPYPRRSFTDWLWKNTVASM